MSDAGAYVTAGLEPPRVTPANDSPVYAPHGNVQSSSPVAIAAGLTQKRTPAPKPKPKPKPKPTKAQVKKPASIGVPSSPSPAPSTGTHSSAGVGAVTPAKVAPALDPLVILGVGIGLFLVVVLLGRKRR